MVDGVLDDDENVMAAANHTTEDASLRPSGEGAHHVSSARLTTPNAAGGIISPEAAHSGPSLQPRNLFREGALGAGTASTRSAHHHHTALPIQLLDDTSSPRVATPGSSARSSRRPSLGCLPEMQACLDALGGEWTSLQHKLTASPRHARTNSLDRQQSCAARLQGLRGSSSGVLDDMLDSLPSCGSRVGGQEGAVHHRRDSQLLTSSSTFVAFDCNPGTVKDDTPPLVRLTGAVRGLDPSCTQVNGFFKRAFVEFVRNICHSGWCGARARPPGCQDKAGRRRPSAADW